LAKPIENVRRILYIWGDPTHAVVSHYRRGWANVQASKTRTDPFAEGGYWGKEYMPSTLEAYAERPGEEMFQFEKHIESYATGIAGSSNIQVAFWDIERKTLQLERLGAFLRVGANVLNSTLSPWEDALEAELLALSSLGNASRGPSMDETAASEAEVASRAVEILDQPSWRLSQHRESQHRRVVGEEQAGLSSETLEKINAKFATLRARTAAFPGNGFFVRGETVWTTIPPAPVYPQLDLVRAARPSSSR
jgi:hypothetical protein